MGFVTQTHVHVCFILVLLVTSRAIHVASIPRHKSKHRHRHHNNKQKDHQRARSSDDHGSFGCAFSPEALQQIAAWVAADGSEPAVSLDANLLSCWAGETGQAVGGMAGAVGGAYVGDAVTTALLGADDEGGSSTVRSIIVGGMALLGGFLGSTAGKAIASSTMQYFLNRPRDAIFRDCYHRLGVDASSSVADIKRAYRRVALEHHPDKGGTQDDMVRDTFCKETLMARARRRQ